MKTNRKGLNATVVESMERFEPYDKSCKLNFACTDLTMRQAFLDHEKIRDNIKKEFKQKNKDVDTFLKDQYRKEPDHSMAAEEERFKQAFRDQKKRYGLSESLFDEDVAPTHPRIKYNKVRRSIQESYLQEEEDNLPIEDSEEEEQHSEEWMKVREKVAEYLNAVVTSLADKLVEDEVKEFNPDLVPEESSEETSIKFDEFVDALTSDLCPDEGKEVLVEEPEEEDEEELDEAILSEKKEKISDEDVKKNIDDLVKNGLSPWTYGASAIKPYWKNEKGWEDEKINRTWTAVNKYVKDHGEEETATVYDCVYNDLVEGAEGIKFFENAPQSSKFTSSDNVNYDDVYSSIRGMEIYGKTAQDFEKCKAVADFYELEVEGPTPLRQARGSNKYVFTIKMDPNTVVLEDIWKYWNKVKGEGKAPKATFTNGSKDED